MVEARKEREIAFHNMRFQNGTRGYEAKSGSAVDKYYSITSQSRACFQRAIEEDCCGKAILEYGCGTGSFAFSLAKQGAQVIGIDISDIAVAKAAETATARGLAARTDFRVMDAEALTFPDHSFDRICGTAILHHLDLHRAFAQLSRCLRPDGEAIFLEPMGHNPAINLYRRLTPAIRTVDEHPLLVRDLELAKKHFEVVEAKYFHLLTLFATPFRSTRVFDRMVKGLDSLDSMLFRMAPYFRRHAWAVVLTFKKPRVAASRELGASTSGSGLELGAAGRRS